MIAIGVDLGGTWVRAARVEGAGFQSMTTRPTRREGTAREVFESLCGAIDEQHPADGVVGIGIGVPSLVDPATGRIHDTTNIPAWQDVPLRQWLEDRYQLPVRLDNDANCFALGEYLRDPSRGDLVGLVMGTGLGAGIISHGRLHSGVHCAAGEFGMIPYRDGIFEHYCSGQFFQRAGTDGQSASQAAERGEPAALRLFAEFGGHLAQLVKVILYALAPSTIVMGGSVSQSAKHFEKALLDGLQDFAFDNAVNLRTSEVPYAAILGAASLVTPS